MSIEPPVRVLHIDENLYHKTAVLRACYWFTDRCYLFATRTAPGLLDVQMRAKSVRGGGRGYQNGGPLFANFSPRLSLFSDHLRTVLAVKGSLRRAQQRRALDGSGPFRTTLLRRGNAHSERLPWQGTTSPPFWYPFSPPPTVSRLLVFSWGLSRCGGARAHSPLPPPAHRRNPRQAWLPRLAAHQHARDRRLGTARGCRPCAGGALPRLVLAGRFPYRSWPETVPR